MASIFFRTAIIYVILSLSMKLMGKREIGELEVGELISSLLISEVCSIPIDDPDIPLLNAIIPVFLIVSTEIILSHIKNKSLKLKKVFDGTPVYLIKDGKIIQSAFSENRISIEEFFSAIRQNEIGRISDVKNCILEPTGKISVLREEDGIEKIIISDGEICEKTLKSLGYDESWMLRKLGSHRTADVFLMTVDEEHNVNIILKEETK